MHHDLIRALILHFAQKAGYSGPPIRVFTRQESWARHFRNRGGLPIGHSPDNLGLTVKFRSHTAIFIDVAKHTAGGQIVDTCAEEAIHAVLSHRHTKKFRDTKAAVLQGWAVGS